MQTIIELDASNWIVLSRDLRRAAGIPRRQKLRASETPGRIVLEMEASTTACIVKRGKLKVWTGGVPATPIAEAVEQARHYNRDSLHATFARRKKAVHIMTRNPPHFQHVSPDLKILTP